MSIDEFLGGEVEDMKCGEERSGVFSNRRRDLRSSDGGASGERFPFTYVLFREAVKYAEVRGLTADYIPDLRTENGILHAVRPNGRLVRLEYTLDWERQNEYVALVEEMVERMRAEQFTTHGN